MKTRSLYHKMTAAFHLILIFLSQILDSYDSPVNSSKIKILLSLSRMCEITTNCTNEISTICILWLVQKNGEKKTKKSQFAKWNWNSLAFNYSIGANCSLLYAQSPIKSLLNNNKANAFRIPRTQLGLELD